MIMYLYHTIYFILLFSFFLLFNFFLILGGGGGVHFHILFFTFVILKKIFIDFILFILFFIYLFIYFLVSFSFQFASIGMFCVIEINYR